MKGMFMILVFSVFLFSLGMAANSPAQEDLKAEAVSSDQVRDIPAMSVQERTSLADRLGGRLVLNSDLTKTPSTLPLCIFTQCENGCVASVGCGVPSLENTGWTACDTGEGAALFCGAGKTVWKGSMGCYDGFPSCNFCWPPRTKTYYFCQ